jgi:hypothetical protein
MSVEEFFGLMGFKVVNASLEPVFNRLQIGLRIVVPEQMLAAIRQDDTWSVKFLDQVLVCFLAL